MKTIPTPQFNPTSDDKSAAKEAESFANADLDKTAKINDHNRKERFKNHLGTAALIIFWIIVTSLSMMALILVYHLITPEKIHFLVNSQIDKLQTILFSAAIIKIGQGYIAKYFH